MSNLPYQPRRRPSRALPAPPPDELHAPAELPAAELPAAELPAAAAARPRQAADEAVGVSNMLDYSQGYTSPPSPPSAPAAAADIPPPPLDALTLDDQAPAAPPPPAASAPGPPSQRVRPPVPRTDGVQTSAAHLNPYHSTLPSAQLAPPTTLTPLRAHYLKKALVNKQIAYELNLITDPVLGANALGLLGSPFVLPDTAKEHVRARAGNYALAEGGSGDLPFLRFMFHQFLLPFPFLASAPPSFWHAKVQPFLSSFLATTGVSTHSTLSDDDRAIAESLMTKDERKEAEDRKKLWTKAEKNLGLMIAVGIKLTGGEEVVRIGQSELRRIDAVAAERKRKWMERHPMQQQDAVFFDVNVVGVRNVTEKGRVRSKHHEEFFIRTERTGRPDVFVSRRYGDFRRLAEELRIHFPDIQLPNPPPKDKTVTTAPATPTTTAGAVYGYAASTLAAYNPLRAVYGTGTTPETTPRNASPVPLDPEHEAGGTGGTLSRERNRLTLRAYIQSILAIPQVANSPVMRSFLLSGPVALTPAEAVDVQRRLDADAVREEGRKRFREEAERRVEALREGLAQFKGDILSREGGLSSVFDVVRRVEFVDDLPPAERSVLEWARISFAATIFHMYVASDTASESLAGLKRLHGIMPYFMLKGILKISNPMAMIRGVLDLFLARPFGGQSLLQKMFSTSLTEEVRYLAEDIAVVQDKIDDPVICQKIEQYANAPFEIQEMLRRDAVAENIDLLVIILRSQEMPVLSRSQVQRVARASRAYREYKAWQSQLEDSDDDDGPNNDDAWLFEDLNILLKLLARKKEKEAMISLIFEGVTAELLKDIITIFYSPLARVYKAASIADSLGDLQAFINDMIRTVEQVEELAQEDPQRTVQTFIDLVQRHEQAFYSFVHNVHSKGQGLFDDLMGWIELFLAYARDGIGGTKLDLEVLLPHEGPERAALLREVDALAQYHYKLKVAHEEKVRRRFLAGAGADQQTLEEAALIDSVLSSLSIGDSTVTAAGEVAVEESEEESSDDEDTANGTGWESEESSAQGSVTGGSRRSSLVNAHAQAHASPHAHPAQHGKAHPPPHQHPHTHAVHKKLHAVKHSKSLSVGKGEGKNAHDHATDDAPPPLPPKDVIAAPAPGRPNRRKRRPRVALAPPETPLITEMRPLFVEVVKQMLVVKPLHSSHEAAPVQSAPGQTPGHAHTNYTT